MQVSREAIETMIAHVTAVAPEEGCGLLAADAGGEVRHAYCLENIERSSVRFTVDPDGHFAALGHAAGNGWDIAGAFHSHPRSSAVPSRTDIRGALDPEWVHVIVGLASPVAEIRAWRIRQGRAIEEPIVVVDEARPCR